ncbi:MAG: hypothetical protein IMY67_12525 [Bacteroidetes bacterium]|nr:hypothetical protein [Bacteroidota bacterium]
MPINGNIGITNNDLGSVEIKNGVFEDDILTFAGAGTILDGTILARDSVSLKLVPFVKGGATNENGIPKAVMTYDVIAAGAGDESVRPAIGGQMSFQRLIIDADGDNTNIDKKVLDQLRDFTIIGLGEQELNILDNQ